MCHRFTLQIYVFYFKKNEGVQENFLDTLGIWIV